MEIDSYSSIVGDEHQQASNVYLFKNGYGMIVRTFELPPNQSELEILNPPANPVHGSLWVQSTPFAPIKSLRTQEAFKKVEIPCQSVISTLKANVGATVELYHSLFGHPQVWTPGKILAVSFAPSQISQTLQPFSALSSPHHRKRSRPSSTSSPMTPQQYSRMYQMQPSVTQPQQMLPQANNLASMNGGLITFETREGILSIPTNYIISVRSPTVLKDKVVDEVSVNSLLVSYHNESNVAGTAVLKYMTHGIAWAPSYNLSLIGRDELGGVDNENSKKIPKTLRMFAKAVIINDCESLKVKELSCIAGFPNIQFSNVDDPIARNDSLEEFLRKLSGPRGVTPTSTTAPHYLTNNAMVMQQQASPMMLQQQQMPPQMPSPITGNSNGNPAPVSSDNDDLHLYHFNDVILPENERVALPMFEAELPYRDVYECKVESTGNYIRNPPQHQQSSGNIGEDVWHSIEFKNATSNVWTTAPVMLTRGHQFLSQDTLSYTLIGGVANVKLTKALDVRVSYEEETGEIHGTVTVSRNNKYQQESIGCRFTIHNFRSEEAVVVIKVTLSGKITKKSIEPQSQSSKTSHDLHNPLQELRYEITVAAGQQREITLTRMVHRRI